MQDSKTEDVETLIRKAADGDVSSQYKLGEHFRSRAAVDVDLEQAFTWYERAARQEHVDAQYREVSCS